MLSAAWLPMKTAGVSTVQPVGGGCSTSFVTVTEEDASGAKARKTYDLHAGDTFWAEHMGAAFQAVGTDIDRELSEYLMELGGMDVLRMWLEPSPGSMVLPNSRIRTEIFRVLRDINIEAEREDVKERLRKSKLGKLVMFYSKVPDELVDNRRICQRLINTWSEAIFGKMTKHTAAAEAEESERAAARGRLRVKSLAEQKAAMGGADQKRIHAFVPQAVPMDFVHRPTGGLKKDHMPKSELHREKTKRLQKKLGEITARQKKGGGRAENVSVEGRGLNVNL